jgi:hypothetical protein
MKFSKWKMYGEKRISWKLRNRREWRTDKARKVKNNSTDDICKNMYDSCTASERKRFSLPVLLLRYSLHHALSHIQHLQILPSSSIRRHGLLLVFLLITLSKVRDLAWLHLLYRWMRYVQLVWTYRMSTLSWGNFLSEEKKVGHDLFRPDVITSRLKAMLPSKLFCHVDGWHTSCLLVIVNSISFSVAPPINNRLILFDFSTLYKLHPVLTRRLMAL